MAKLSEGTGMSKPKLFSSTRVSWSGLWLHLTGSQRREEGQRRNGKGRCCVITTVGKIDLFQSTDTEWISVMPGVWVPTSVRKTLSRKTYTYQYYTYQWSLTAMVLTAWDKHVPAFRVKGSCTILTLVLSNDRKWKYIFTFPRIPGKFCPHLMWPSCAPGVAQYKISVGIS